MGEDATHICGNSRRAHAHARIPAHRQTEAQHTRTHTHAQSPQHAERDGQTHRGRLAMVGVTLEYEVKALGRCCTSEQNMSDESMGRLKAEA